jgi:hypothetical protein
VTDDITQISIKDYLEGIGIPTRKEGSKYFASSPFSSDRNWSFCVYPTNTYFDWSSGSGGNILNLVSRLENISLSDAAKKLREGVKYEKYKPNYKASRAQSEHREPFDYEKYTNQDPAECEEIKAYAASRGITEGYFCGVFYTRDFTTKGWIRVPALGFLHVDKNLKPCGAKFRKIRKSPDSDQSVRFSARGSLNFYILSTKEDSKPYLKDTVLYVVEGEANANSLRNVLRKLSISAVILSTGGVSMTHSLIGNIPPEYLNFPKKVIIDYDGNEELYQQRIKLYEELKAEPIKMILPKGEDINSLYVKGEIWKIENLLV